MSVAIALECRGMSQRKFYDPIHIGGAFWFFLTLSFDCLLPSHYFFNYTDPVHTKDFKAQFEVRDRSNKLIGFSSFF